MVETNPFRHLNHLTLKLVAANDLYLKKYLAKCLLQLKVRGGERGGEGGEGGKGKGRGEEEEREGVGEE